jgi:hypothetical protein
VVVKTPQQLPVAELDLLEILPSVQLILQVLVTVGVLQFQEVELISCVCGGQSLKTLVPK